MIRSANVIGLGALGMLFGGILAEHAKDTENECVRFVMDEERYLRHRTERYSVNGEAKEFPLQSCADASPADLVIVAVKYNALPDALDTIYDCAKCKDTGLLDDGSRCSCFKEKAAMLMKMKQNG